MHIFIHAYMNKYIRAHMHYMHVFGPVCVFIHTKFEIYILHSLFPLYKNDAFQ